MLARDGGLFFQSKWRRSATKTEVQEFGHRTVPAIVRTIIGFLTAAMRRWACSRRIAAVVTTIIPLVAAPVILALGLAARVAATGTLIVALLAIGLA